jgi:hypothetical protein
MSPGVTFRRRPVVALALLLVIGGALSYMSVGKGTPAATKAVALTYAK